ncbi:MAG: hypothetical protein OQK50_01720 [Deltaproteobacteria bacterium]|nr:hypothetical protein [Deltaproteobacteria bacterium]MCW8892146.1 hypothetical protein [Deltaproteobacteria bacterium]MCW9049033.1 hypothetical protein [Deltaproteobacteria bacterium]
MVKKLPEKNITTWWGDHILALDANLRWTIGPFSLHVCRREKEWRLWHYREDQENESEEIWSIDEGVCLETAKGEVQRNIFTQTDENLAVMPLLADRSVVVKTRTPLQIEAGQQVNLFVSTPLWVAIHVGTEKVAIQEIPIILPSDTWFGPSTMEGELCYSSTTQGRLYLQDLPTRPHRAISPVLIENQTSKPLLLNQLSLPVPYLSLFDSGEWGLWTEAITLLNADETELAKVSVAEAPPAPYENSPKIAGPRKKADKHMLLRTFSALFS